MPPGSICLLHCVPGRPGTTEMQASGEVGASRGADPARRTFDLARQAVADTGYSGS